MATVERTRCSSNRSDGERCGAFVGPNGTECINHDPAMAEALVESRRAGGAATRKPGVIAVMRAKCDEAAEQQVGWLLSIASDPAEAPNVRINALKEAWDRAYGRAPQSVEISGPDGGPVAIAAVPLSPDDLAAAARALVKVSQ